MKRMEAAGDARRASDIARIQSNGEPIVPRSRRALLVFRPGMAGYETLCAASEIEPSAEGWGAVACRTRDNKELTVFTQDMARITDLALAAQTAKLSDTYLLASEFPVIRAGWPAHDAESDRWDEAFIPSLLLAFNFAFLTIAGLSLAGVLIPKIPWTDLYILSDSPQVTLGLAALFGVGSLVPRGWDWPSGLSDVASRTYQACIRRRLCALTGTVIALGGLAGLFVANVFSASTRHNLAGAAIGASVAAVGGLAKLVGRRRSLGREIVAMLRRASRTGARLQDQELASLGVVLATTWTPGSRTSWMTAEMAKDFIDQLALPEEERVAYFPPCLERMLHWAESGSGLVGAFHPDMFWPVKIHGWLGLNIRQTARGIRRDLLRSWRSRINYFQRWFVRTKGNAKSQ